MFYKMVSSIKKGEWNEVKKYTSRHFSTYLWWENTNYQRNSWNSRSTVKEVHPDDNIETFTYDTNGNILTHQLKSSRGQPIDDETYQYSSTIKDQLISITDGFTNNSIIKEFKYEGSYKGNPTAIITNGVTQTLTWEGRKLKQIGNIGFAYNEDGIRIRKMGTDYIEYYMLDGSKVIGLQRYYEKEGYNMYFTYDEQEEIVGLSCEGKEYFYIRDITGNIIKIIDEDGSCVVQYDYDAWGNFKKTVNIECLVAEHNPFVYKGYFFDEETQLFYCNSRYYDPETGRFISLDSIDYLDSQSINGLNLYCYCMNNPIMYGNPSGHSAILIGLIIGAIVGVTIGFGTAAYIDYQDDGQIFNGSVAWYDYLGATVLGGAAGAAIGAGIGYIALQIGSALSSFAAQKFTIGVGLSLSSNGAAVMSAGLTITGTQILQGAALLAEVTVMAAILGKSGGYTVKQFPNDHDSAHVHIFGDDIADKAHGIRIGIDGNPLPGQGKLPPGAKKALKKLWEKILRALLK